MTKKITPQEALAGLDALAEERRASAHVSPTAGTEAEPDDDEDDDPWAIDSEEMVIREQRAIAVYMNQFGGLVIRQERDAAFERDDHIVVLTTTSAAYKVLKAMEKVLEEMKEHNKNGG
ncbi:hypothetical protein EN943_20130 [Mesorhizobium sp. M7A.F.Ca.US.006.01.1.1]|uniref:hypothetical protein n=1 Tax=Mesorhizobium sp. M7A.F.Ca.US.006.01.1.1 TaxID=2496707 RepID=UPI000FCBC109|nr:hypothetical protein [Mesorhizobium sp. M7A.F.Ca.US.006.01.1.1]RUZ75617.1 hypothetical protein EN943_20130 [Mesorhizobium sp. M7A.F.Ca.US.006.01.1.1]